MSRFHDCGTHIPQSRTLGWQQARLQWGEGVSGIEPMHALYNTKSTLCKGIKKKKKATAKTNKQIGLMWYMNKRDSNLCPDLVENRPCYRPWCKFGWFDMKLSEQLTY